MLRKLEFLRACARVFMVIVGTTFAATFFSLVLTPGGWILLVLLIVVLRGA